MQTDTNEQMRVSLEEKNPTALAAMDAEADKIRASGGQIIELTDKEKAYVTETAPFHNPDSIVEAHPTIIAKMIAKGWATKTKPAKIQPANPDYTTPYIDITPAQTAGVMTTKGTVKA